MSILVARIDDASSVNFRPLQEKTVLPNSSSFTTILTWNTSSFTVSPANTSEIVGVIDWEGSHVAPIWDGSFPREEADELFAQRATALAGAGFGTGSVSTTRLWSERLMYLIDIPIGDVQLRGWETYQLEKLYLEWYDNARGTGLMSDAEIEGFVNLASFIKEYREGSFEGKST
ncbi:hypothetical protein FB45DRAFT_1031891 [Roridomyces roridus]|uniref:Uncharacterized protein n=1 Tax=Roridomyces roridus TaxID=1738132 RepID=A0AAD7BIS1_9AGAR|nr:hypothetical protein FB45DRAFT_1031891 [Roridomyces roridus]